MKKRARVIVRTGHGTVQLIEDVVEIELLPSVGLKFASHQDRDGAYPTRMRLEPVRAHIKAQVVPIKGKVGTD